MTPLLLSFLIAASPSSTPLVPTNAAYPYRGTVFSGFVTDSFGKSGTADRFYGWMTKGYRTRGAKFADRPHASLDEYLAFKRKDLAGTHDRTAKVRKEMAFAGGLHRMVKTVIPKFSLDRGFEFKNTVALGERQCFLQSVLIAGLLQKAGVPAGVAMVNRNIEGLETNNKHAICFARLSDGRDLIVDASDPTPFVRQQGLFVASTGGGYRFVRPIYDAQNAITAYREYTRPVTLTTAAIQPLDVPFVRSQFEYYRGERTDGGVMAKRKTTPGLTLAAQHLEKSVALSPNNPLSVYMLGKVRLMLNQRADARQRLEQAMVLYRRDGWVPPDERMALASLAQVTRR